VFILRKVFMRKLLKEKCRVPGYESKVLNFSAMY